jgi:hypothetical protein
MMTNPTYRLTETQRLHISILGHLCEDGRDQTRRSRRWSKTAVAKAYGVSTKTVLNCMARYPAEVLQA